jgi:hypothetical protein
MNSFCSIIWPPLGELMALKQGTTLSRHSSVGFDELFLLTNMATIRRVDGTQNMAHPFPGTSAGLMNI